MLESAETLQQLVNRAAEQQRKNDLIMRYRNAGDEEMARFYELPEQVQQTMLAKQDIQDAAAAAAIGDATGLQRGIRSAVNRAIYGGAQLGKPERRAPPPRRRGR